MSPPPRRNDNGLTTLEWLLIVAAVAGLAALAVVLVQNVVDDTAEQIAGSSARITAAKVAAKAISDDTEDDDEREAACRRLDITYSSAFAEVPNRAAFWSDPKTTVVGDGNCFIVTTAAKSDLQGAGTELRCTGASNSVKTDYASKASELDGRTVDWDNDASPQCHLT